MFNFVYTRKMSCQIFFMRNFFFSINSPSLPPRPLPGPEAPEARPLPPPLGRHLLRHAGTLLLSLLLHNIVMQLANMDLLLNTVPKRCYATVCGNHLKASLNIFDWYPPTFLIGNQLF